ncbi:MAG: glycosyltransferase family 9 protein [Bacteroidetes bacterium]|nr:glycosyltransferase family 9 protein [Bacteroidota bacterium]
MKRGEPGSILIIRLSSMGDVVLTTHLVRNLRIAFPKARIDFITAKPFSEIYRLNPHITNLYEYDKNWDNSDIKMFKKNIMESCNYEKYDLLIDLQRNIRTLLLRKGLGKKIVKVRKNRLNKLSLVYLKKNIFKEIKPIPEIYFDTISEFNVNDDGKGLDLWLQEDKASGNYLTYSKNIVNNDKISIAIAPGAYHTTKRWLPERFAELIKVLKKNYNAETTLIGGISDIEITKKIIELSGENVIDNSGSDSIISTAKIIDNCNLLITNDTGLMHIAAARQVAVVAIFGSTVKDFGFTPFRVNHFVVEKDIPCRPCTHIGRNSCPKGHFNCMNDISVDDVSKAVESILNNNSNRK